VSGDPTGEMAPGDEAPSGTPGAGENTCPACGGTGQLEGAACQTCAGTGMVIEEVGAPRTVRPSSANPGHTQRRSWAAAHQ
jgi:DnaJ-class molecular chaperone